jgi:uncharacterized damage-inducible protein DinB
MSLRNGTERPLPSFDSSVGTLDVSHRNATPWAGSPCHVERPALPLILLLRQLACVIEDLTEAQYAQKPVGVVESSIGAHVRHCMDHVAALLTAVRSGVLDYDARRRGTSVETSRVAALESIDETVRRLTELPPSDLHRSLLLSVTLAVGAQPMRVRSSVGRELAYVVSHTIHHNALIGAMVRTLGGTLLDRFGYAPSTVAHLEAELRCARSA